MWVWVRARARVEVRAKVWVRARVGLGLGRIMNACMASLLPAWLQANPNPNPNPNPNLHGELVAGVAAAVDDVEGGHGQVHLVGRVAREHGDVLVQRQALGRGAW